MGSRCFALFALLVAFGLSSGAVGAGERAGPIRIGVLTESWGPSAGAVGLRDGLLELGYREGEHFVIGVRFTQGDAAALPDAARDLVRNGADLLFTTGPHAVQAARMATERLPIVFAGPLGDPVGLGLVRSFARPGGNVTGVTDLDLELGPKRLEIFWQIVPGLKRVLFPYEAREAYMAAAAKGYREAARRLGIVLVESPIRTQEEAQATLAKVRKGDVDGILAPSSVSLNLPGLVLEASSRSGVPAIFTGAFWTERGGLASYGPDYHASGRQAARLVQKIMTGADPATIPVEANAKIEFAINTKTAAALGLTLPPDVLYRADRIVQ